MRANHLGSAVVVFENAFSFDESLFRDVISGIEENTKPQGYKDSDEKKDIKVSEGGYEYSEEDINLAPNRYVEYVYEGMPKEHIDFAIGLEKALYNCVILYARMFPVIMANIRWRTRGYFIKYENGQSIGPHSDCDLPYGPDNVTPLLEFPLANTLTSGIMLNNDFDGGEIGFMPWGISVKPKAGDAIMYPSAFTGCHHVDPVTDGVRYAYLQWFAQGTVAGTPDKNVMESGDLDKIKWVRKLREDVIIPDMDFARQKYVEIGHVDWVQPEEVKYK